jgi:hypothetical protein
LDDLRDLSYDGLRELSYAGIQKAALDIGPMLGLVP